MTKILPVIMCGGAGTRVWPESRETMPKQFIALIGERSTFQDDGRARGRSDLRDADRHHQHEYRFLVTEQLAEIGAEATIVIEPVAARFRAGRRGRALSLAARPDPETVVAVFAADHVVRTRRELPRALQRRGRGGRAGYIVTLGVKPTEPAIGYGYIRPGEAIDGGRRVSRSRRFVEKPDARDAERYVAEGYLWNSGNFFFRADVMLGELQRFEPEMADAAARGDRQGRARPRLSRARRGGASANRRKSRSTTP